MAEAGATSCARVRLPYFIVQAAGQAQVGQHSQFDHSAGPALWPTTALQPARRNGPLTWYYSPIFLFLDFIL
jgi:hypothetical protein